MGLLRICISKNFFVNFFVIICSYFQCNLNVTKKYRRNQNGNRKEKKSWKRFLSTVGAGVIGSVLTLGVVSNTDLLPELHKKPIAVQQTIPLPIIRTNFDKKRPLSLSDMVEHASNAIVGVVNYQSTGNRFAQNVKVQSGTGSGVIYKIDGDNAYIVTNNHVIEGADKIEVSLENGEKTTAELVGKTHLVI